MHSVFECVLYNRIVYFYMSWQKLSCARTGKCIINFYGALCTMCLAFSYIYKYTNHPALQTHSHTHVLYYSSRINAQYADEPYECFTIICFFFSFFLALFCFYTADKMDIKIQNHGNNPITYKNASKRNPFAHTMQTLWYDNNQPKFVFL